MEGAPTAPAVSPRGVALVMASIVSVQFGAAFAKTIIDDIGPIATVFLRVAIAAIIMCAIARPPISSIVRADRLLVVGFGLSLAGMNVAYYAAIQRLPIGVTVTIEFVGPLAVAIAGSHRRLDVAWALLAGVGLILLSPISGNDLDGWGVVLALTAGACWAAYILLSSRVGGRFAGLDGLALALVVAALVTAVPAAATAGTEMFRPEVLAIGGLVAVLASAVPYGLELEALRLLTTGAFGMLMSLEPVVAAFAGWVVLQEGLGALEMAAIVLVLLANLGSATTRAA